MTRTLRRAARAAAAPAAALIVASCAARTGVVAPMPRPPSHPTPAPPPVATPVATPVPTTVPEEPVPAGSLPDRPDVRPPLVRVLLQPAEDPVFPEPGRRFVCTGGGEPVVLRGPLSARPVGGRAAIQVGAFAQDANARAVLVRLAASGFEGTVSGEGDQKRRVIALAGQGENPDALAQRLRQAGFTDQAPATAAYGAIVVEGEGGTTLGGAVVRVIPIDPDPVRFRAKSLRGEFELRPTGGGVQVVNVVNLEEYLRGVVPAEMGPRAFPLLEALKAQAVAARTYAVAHLDDHAAEGYDLCDTQMCQVYEGVGAEQPLSDRAVSETAGEVVTYHGQPIDAMYHSTCAGHTEDGQAVFPQRAEPYLKGVACRGERTLAAGVASAPGPWVGEVEHLAAVGGAVAGALGVPTQARALTARLTGTRPGQGVAGLARAFGVANAPATLRIASGAASEESTLELLRAFHVPLPPAPRGAGRGGWELAVAVRLGQLTGAIQAVNGRLVPGPSGLRLVADGSDASKDFTGRETLLERRGGSWRANSIEFPAGSPATLWCSGDVCPAVEVEPLASADGGSAWTWWVREMSLEEIGKRLSLAGVRTVTVTRRGVSGRALAVAVGAGTGTTELAGLAFRRALELPDTLFVVTAARNARVPSVRFLGRGWGHGVGMCQNGAFGLARGGASYAEILKTYYTGVEISQWERGDHEDKPEAGKRDP